jgi:hypothetical protein
LTLIDDLRYLIALETKSLRQLQPTSITEEL